jgi:hypothetical protein
MLEVIKIVEPKEKVPPVPLNMEKENVSKLKNACH